MPKVIQFIGTSQKDIRSFPDSAKRAIGYQLQRVQLGLDPMDWKPFPTIGQGVREIRIRQDGQYRVFYLMQLEQTIYVLHAFHKKSQKTPKSDVALATSRFKQLMDAKK
jgi:phage-related protein